MSFPRTIIYIGDNDNKTFVYTVQGYKYLIDDVTEDGEVYIEYVDEWINLFISDADLEIIREYKCKEELRESILLFMMSKIEKLSVD
jgi:hypothetical protein